MARNQLTIKAILEALAEKKGAEKEGDAELLNPAVLAERMQVPLTLMLGAFPTRKALIMGLQHYWIQQFTEAYEARKNDFNDPTLTPEEVLQELMMMKLDILSPHKSVIRSIVAAAQQDPCLALSQIEHLNHQAVLWISLAQLSSEGSYGVIRSKALCGIYTYAVYTWLQQGETPISDAMLATMAKMMARLTVPFPSLWRR